MKQSIVQYYVGTKSTDDAKNLLSKLKERRNKIFMIHLPLKKISWYSLALKCVWLDFLGRMI